jgi:transposase
MKVGSMSIQVYVGADIAVESIQIDWFNVSNRQGQQVQIGQQKRDYARFVKQLTKQVTAEQIHVVMEATGNYWIAFAEYLHQAGLQVSVLNPTQAKHFAQARLQRTKTDRVDAHLLREYGRLMEPAVWTPPPAICQQLQQYLNRRDDLIAMHNAERNRLHALQHHPLNLGDLLTPLQARIRSLKAQIEQLEYTIQTLLLSQHEWGEMVRRLRTIKGLGYLTIARILTSTHAFARCSTPDEAVSFAGLAPHVRQSGKWKGKSRIGGGGHASLRQSLYMASLSASRFNPPLHAFYRQLRQRGKLEKVALCAVARKLLILAWTLVVKQRDFDPLWASKSHLPA